MKFLLGHGPTSCSADTSTKSLPKQIKMVQDAGQIGILWIILNALMPAWRGSESNSIVLRCSIYHRVLFSNQTRYFKSWTRFHLISDQSALTAKKTVCTSINETRAITSKQQDAFWSWELREECPKPCDVIYYTASTTVTKQFGGNTTWIYVAFETLHTSLEEEVPLYDEISMISAVGGSLGLFLGFSFLEISYNLIRLLQNRAGVK